eukprot:1641280-Pyramimonas_sp.AAC.1
MSRSRGRTHLVKIRLGACSSSVHQPIQSIGNLIEIPAGPPSELRSPAALDLRPVPLMVIQPRQGEEREQ